MDFSHFRRILLGIGPLTLTLLPVALLQWDNVSFAVIPCLLRLWRNRALFITGVVFLAALASVGEQLNALRPSEAAVWLFFFPL